MLYNADINKINIREVKMAKCSIPGCNNGVKNVYGVENPVLICWKCSKKMNKTSKKLKGK